MSRALLGLLTLVPALVAQATPSRGGLTVYPETIALRGPSDRHGVLVSGADGTDVSHQARLWSSDPQVFSVGTNGLCTPVGNGQATLWVSYQGQTNQIPLRVEQVAVATIPSFRREIEPVLTRQGCNMGACHGKLAGQNGFRLSLRGYAPELDYRWIATEIAGRRLNPAFPEESLLVQKSIGGVPHEGGVRFVPGSRYHRLFVDWITARAPYVPPGLTVDQEPTVTGLEIFPGDRIVHPGDAQQLLVRATWSDGRKQDVTWLTQFFSNNEPTVTVTADGFAKVQRSGETSIRAHFLGQVAVVRFTIPSPNVVEEWRYARRQNPVDDHVFAKLAALQIPPSPRTDDRSFLRRALLDTLGTLPTPEEVRAFSADPRPDKRDRLIDSLFQRPEFVDYWTLQLADLLQNRKERDHDVRGNKNVRAFHRWLRQEVAGNRPWNELVRDLLTARGDAVTHPEIGYFTYLIGEKNSTESDVTDAVAQAFLGTRIGCARCHNHPLERYTQDDFYHFAAFFQRVSLDRKEPNDGVTRLFVQSRDEREREKRRDEAATKFAEAQARLLQATDKDAVAARQSYTDRQRELGERKRELQEAHAQAPVAHQPRTQQALLAQSLDRTPMSWQSGEDPRARLTDWMTSPTNPYFAAAIVNRLWKHFLGVGLVEPVDDLRASNPPSNPQLLELLQRELVTSGYDLRRVMQLILKSRTYQLSSRTVPGNATETRFYSHYYARRLPAEVLADAVSAATGVPDKFDGFPVGLKAIQLPEPTVSSYFLTLFGRSERITACACERAGEVTLPQLLNLQNGDELQKKIESSDGRLKALLAHPAPLAETIHELYLAVLNRPPTADEVRHCTGILGTESPPPGLPDLFWALLNSKEFAFNH